MLRAPHPSPLAANNGHTFRGCHHFSHVNSWFREHGEAPFDWRLT